MNLENLLTLAITPRAHEGIRPLIDAIHKFSRETTLHELEGLEGIALDLGFAVRIDRRRKAVILASVGPSWMPHAKPDIGCAL